MLKWREEQFRRWLGSARPRTDLIPDYHLSGDTGGRGYAVLVDREVAVTRSITQLELDSSAGEIAVHYWPNPTTEPVAETSRISTRIALSAPSLRDVSAL